MKYLLILLLSISLCNAGTIDPNTSDSKYLEYGSKHECVVQVDCISDSNQQYKGSGVVINKRWVLTAAHVIIDTKSVYIIYNNKKIKVIATAYPEKFHKNEFGVGDIALCYLDENINLNFYPELYTKDDEVGKVCGLAGYGFTGTFITGAKKYDGLKRAGSNIIDEIDKEFLVCSNYRSKKTELEFLICSGDSGGGLFIDKKLAGIHSCIWSNDGKLDSDYGDFSGHTRIMVYKSWIRNTITKIEKAVK